MPYTNKTQYFLLIPLFKKNPIKGSNNKLMKIAMKTGTNAFNDFPIKLIKPIYLKTTNINDIEKINKQKYKALLIVLELVTSINPPLLILLPN
jgi:hypothetical protein